MVYAELVAEPQGRISEWMMDIIPNRHFLGDPLFSFPCLMLVGTMVGSTLESRSKEICPTSGIYCSLLFCIVCYIAFVQLVTAKAFVFVHSERAVIGAAESTRVVIGDDVTPTFTHRDFLRCQ